jgi:hypothetical protein
VALIQQDLVPGSGDQLLTLDTDTNLQWLNLTATANRSYQEVLADFGGFMGIGFRYATVTEVTGLLDHFSITPSPTPISANAIPIETFIKFMDGKSAANGINLSVSGLFKQTTTPSSPNTPVLGIFMLLNKAIPGGSMDSTLIGKAGVRLPNVSSFLVKPV